MRLLNDTKRTRFKLTTYFGLIIACLIAYSIYSKLEGVATVLAGSLGVVVAKYSHDETNRKSLDDES